MSAIPLFDLLSNNAAGNSSTSRDLIKRFAENVVAEAIRRFEQTEALDKQCGTSIGSPLDRDVAVLLRSMYEEDVQYAERVLARVAKFAGGGEGIAGADRLRDRYGRTRAMLSVSLEDIEAGKAEIRQGNFFTGAQVRHELQRKILEAGAAHSGTTGN